MTMTRETGKECGNLGDGCLFSHRENGRRVSFLALALSRSCPALVGEVLRSLWCRPGKAAGEAEAGDRVVCTCTMMKRWGCCALILLRPKPPVCNGEVERLVNRASQGFRKTLMLRREERESERRTRSGGGVTRLIVDRSHHHRAPETRVERGFPKARASCARERSRWISVDFGV